ncbi:hypothetical protein AC629_04000 [Bradyrhizobium sp. NAS80.1]|uniref:hypothetical protein n=1 Tax=Bradyrhizobium sp. NAS80.1 TaxID=1680159 RepID=UPI00096388F7|nr:hypothetical protein [Bradyrhizobium sp. NAS80.1]OKO90740.1 hypothetical protein AC629_04000 [Bradyrhizobium sp. NAS80.1]
MIRRLFQRKKAVTTPEAVLPDEVATAIEMCGVIFRDDAEKTLVNLWGFTPFYYSKQGSIDAIRAAFPGLTDNQYARAARYLDSTVAKRAMMQGSARADRPKWRDWKPLRVTE